MSLVYSQSATLIDVNSRQWQLNTDPAAVHLILYRMGATSDGQLILDKAAATSLRDALSTWIATNLLPTA